MIGFLPLPFFSRIGCSPSHSISPCLLFFSIFRYLERLVKRFPTPYLSTFIAAAHLRNYCRTKGVQAGPIDFLIATACCEHGFPLLTADKDFLRIAKYCDLVTLPVQEEEKREKEKSISSTPRHIRI